jgi:hypothetical protein
LLTKRGQQGLDQDPGEVLGWILGELWLCGTAAELALEASDPTIKIRLSHLKASGDWCALGTEENGADSRLASWLFIPL